MACTKNGLNFEYFLFVSNFHIKYTLIAIVCITQPKYILASLLQS